MTREEYMKAAEDVIYLASCAVNGGVPDPARAEGMDISSLYRVADFHMLTAITAMALESAGVHDPEFAQAKAKAIRKTALMDTEMNALFARLNAAEIWYMPLKGTVLKDFYPVYGMRQMADRDILFDADRADDVKTIMESLGFTAQKFGSDVHDCYYKQPLLNFEMHRALFSSRRGEKLYEYYKDVDSRLIKEDGYQRRFTPEDFYVYLIAHAYKHFSGGGTGLRSLLDTYLYLKKTPIDLTCVSAETERLGIREFEEKIRSLSLHLFSGEELTSADREMLDYILSCGTYGSVQNRVKNRISQYGNGPWAKQKYIFSRLFLPLDVVRASFPLFIKCPILLPFLPFYRVFRGFTARKTKMKAELKTLAAYKTMKDEKADR